jgi:hypothetical protein
MRHRMTEQDGRDSPSEQVAWFPAKEVTLSSKGNWMGSYLPLITNVRLLLFRRGTLPGFREVGSFVGMFLGGLSYHGVTLLTGPLLKGWWGYILGGVFGFGAGLWLTEELETRVLFPSAGRLLKKLDQLRTQISSGTGSISTALLDDLMRQSRHVELCSSNTRFARKGVLTDTWVLLDAQGREFTIKAGSDWRGEEKERFVKELSSRFRS